MIALRLVLAIILAAFGDFCRRRWNAHYARSIHVRVPSEDRYREAWISFLYLGLTLVSLLSMLAVIVDTFVRYLMSPTV